MLMLGCKGLIPPPPLLILSWSLLEVKGLTYSGSIRELMEVGRGHF